MKMVNAAPDGEKAAERVAAARAGKIDGAGGGPRSIRFANNQVGLNASWDAGLNSRIFMSRTGP